ncbi:MAG: response regulator [Acidobacteriota bacterium]
MPTTILVADESPTVLRNVKVILEQDGYDVVGASDMSTVQAAIAGGGHLPGLVLIDAELPPTDGYTACRSLKDSDATAHVPVLLMVGTFVPLDRDALEACHAEGFITKPFDPLALKARVKEVARDLPEPPREDTRRMRLLDTPKPASSPEVIAQIDALSGVPEIDADDLPELPDQESLLPPEDEGDRTLTEPSAKRGPGGGAAPDREASPNVVAFAPRAEGGFPSEDSLENLTDAERRIIEDNERVLRQVADTEEATAGGGDEAHARRLAEATPTDLAALVEEPDIPPGAIAAIPTTPPAISEASRLSRSPSDSSEEELFDLDDSQSILRGIDASDEDDADTEQTGPVLAVAVPEPPRQSGTAGRPAAAPTGHVVPEDWILDPAILDRIVAEVLRRMSDAVVREIVWEVVPELAELYVKRKIEEDARKRGE